MPYESLQLKCQYGFSQNDFSRKSDQWRARRKTFQNQISNSLLKSGTFGLRPRKQKPGNE